jgi:hypothetical protein
VLTIDTLVGATCVVTNASVAVAYVSIALAIRHRCGADHPLPACEESQVATFHQ